MTINIATPPAAKNAPAGPVTLRGTGRGLEILVDARPPLAALVAALATRLEQSPGFFSGTNDVVVRLEHGPLPAGALGALEGVAARFGLRIVEVRQDAAGAGVETRAGIVSRAPLATESGIGPVLAARASAAEALDAPRMHVGPVRSGVVLEVPGPLVVVGDVNPGAEVRAGGSIVVAGALRGLAHAGVDPAQPAFILALRLEAQQLRVGTLIARAGDAASVRGAEIAYAAKGQIVVESYQGKVPGGSAPARR